MKQLKNLFPVIVLVAVAIGFVGGMQTEKLLKKSSATATATTGQQNGGFGGGRQGGGRMGNGERPTFGTVTAVSDSTITVDSRNGGSINVAISSTTKITGSDNASASASDIKTGDTIVAFGNAGSDGTIAATQIRLNPTMGGTGQTQSDSYSPGSSSSSSSSSTTILQ